MNYKLLPAFLFILFCSVANKVSSQVNVNPGLTAADLVQRLTGTGVTVMNPVLTCPSAANGSFQASYSNLGLDSGILLTTGRAVTAGGSAIGVNGSYNFLASTSNGTPGDVDLTALTNVATYDACKLEFDFIPAGDSIKFQYVFGSEEYTLYACTSYNDAFGFFISGPGYAVQKNLALVPGTNIPVAINTINSGAAGLYGNIANCNNMGAGSPFPAYYVNNNASYTTVTYNGFTKVLNAVAAVTPCATYHLKLVIADGGDSYYDSGVFLKKGSLSSPTITASTMGGTVNGNIGVTVPEPYSVRGCLNGKFIFKRPAPKPTPQTVKYQITGTAVNGTDYTWIPDSVIIPANDTIATRTITSLSSATGSKLVKLRIYSPNGCSNVPFIDSVSLAIYDSLYAHIITPDTTICTGQSLAIQTSGDNLLSYSWSPGTGLNNSTIKNPVITPAANTTYVLTTSFPGSTCPASHSQITVSLPAGPAAGSNSPVCAGSALNLAAATVAGATYSWTGPNGFTSSQQNPGLPGFTGIATGIYSVKTTVAGCISQPSTVSVAIGNAPSQPTAISGNAGICSGTSQTYSVTPVAGATSYSWTLPSGWSGTSITSNINATAGVNGGMVSVSAGNACGSSAASSLNVTINPLITPVVSISTPSVAICPGATTIFTASPVNCGTSPSYQWKINGLNAGTNSPVFNAASMNNGDMVSLLMTSNAACVSSSSVASNSISMTVNPMEVPGININTTPPTILCAGTQLTFVTNITGGGTNPQYQWQKNGINVGTNASVYTDNALANGDTISVVLTSNAACLTTGTAFSNKLGLTVMPNVVPTVNVIATPGVSFVPDQQVTFTASITNGGSTPSFQWKKNGVNIPFATGNIYTTNTLHEGDIITVTVQSTAPCTSPSVVSSSPIIMTAPTGITPVGSWEGSLTIYPNPNNGHFSVKANWGAAHAGQRVHIDVVNCIGQPVYSSEFKPEHAEWTETIALDESLASGLYLLRLNTEGMQTVKPFLIKK